MKNPLNKKMLFFLRKSKYFLFLLALLTGISLLLYREYVFGGKLFLFEDFGSDSVRVSLPTYLYYFEWLKNGMPLWSDKMGIGTSILSHSEIIFDPFTYLLFIFGKSKIIYMFTYIVIIKIILSGVFFWMLAGKFKLSQYARIIGALTYAFGGYIIVFGQNFVFGTIYVYLPIILLGFEIWLKDKKMWLLTLMLMATALYFYYLFYMTSFFLSLYAIFRYLTIYNFKLKHFLKYLMSLAICGLFALGLSAFFWLPAASLTLNSLRVGAIDPSFLKLITPDYNAFFTAIARPFGYDILGGPKDYIGFGFDYFQLTLYFGIISILLIPQIFYKEEKKKIFSYLFLIISLLILLFIPFFPYMLNGFSDITYRWAYFLHISIALLLSIAIDKIFNKGKFSYKILFATIAAIVVASIAVYIYIFINGNSNTLHRAAKIFLSQYIFIAAYIILLILSLRLTKYRNPIKIIILALIFFELIWAPRHFINDRLTTTPDPVKHQLGYFDKTNQAINYLNQTDKDIYRIEKSYDSVISEYGQTPSDNDSMAQNYRGLKSYNANNQPNYIRFLQDAGVYVMYPTYQVPKGTDPQDIKGQLLNYINGVGDRYLLQSFLGVKYYLTKGDVKLPEYYKYVTKVDGINIYKNENYLPLGFTLDSYLTQKEYMQLKNEEKDKALLSSVVIDNEEEIKDFLKNSCHSREDGNPAPPKCKNESSPDIKRLISQRRAENLKITSYKDDNITGNINISENKILVLSIPFNKGWTAYVDDQEVLPLRVDSGLIGIKLTPGSHTIKLDFLPPNLKLGIIISLISIILYILYRENKKLIEKTRHPIEINTRRFYNTYIKKILSYIKAVHISIKERSIAYREKTIYSKFLIIMNTIKTIDKKLIFFAFSILGLIIFLSAGFLTRGDSYYNLFQSNRNDYHMDFYKPLSELVDGPYAHGSIYPPLPQLAYKEMLRFVPYDIAIKGASSIRKTQEGQMVFLMYQLLTLSTLFILIMTIKKGTNFEKYIFILVILFSAPFLFLFERANIILIALLSLMIFTFFKDSKNLFFREIALISLSVSIAIKLYPAIFIIWLLKDKRHKDLIKVLIYSLILFIFPLFLMGGPGQLLIFIHNLFFASNNITSWGTGYSVNIESTARSLGALFGNFGETPILIGKILTFAILILGAISAFITKSKWKTAALLSLLMILIPSISYEYSVIFMIIPLIMFLDKDHKYQSGDFIYLLCFVLLFIPFTLSPINAINHGFGPHARPLTYGILIQDIVLCIMMIYLIFQGLREKKLNEKQ
jgi:uncharacterized membrane protein YfhO